MDLYSLIDQMYRQRMVQRVTDNPQAQFGTETRTYLGANLLPERNVPENAFVEDAIRYRTVIANSGTRYSPSQKKGEGLITGAFTVVLGESDIAREFTSRDYDALLTVLSSGQSMQAMVTMLRWVDTVINRALVELNEAQRWNAICGASVVRKGDNGYTETVAYSNPAGHRTAAGGQWSLDTYDPYEDLLGKQQMLSDKGYTVNRIIMDRASMNKLLRNANVVGRLNNVVVTTGAGGGQPLETRSRGRVTQADLNQMLAADGLPPLETYDLTYNDEAGTKRFFPANTCAMISTTGRDESILVGEQLDLIENTLGYTAIGRPAGQSKSGRVVRMEAFDNKPPRVEAEGWQTALPVITEPEAIAIISGIS